MPELLADMAGRSLVFYIDEPARVKEQADAIELEFRESMEQRARKAVCAAGTDEYSLQRRAGGGHIGEKCRGDTGYHGDQVRLFPDGKHVDIAARNIAPITTALNPW